MTGGVASAQKLDDQSGFRRHGLQSVAWVAPRAAMPRHGSAHDLLPVQPRFHLLDKADERLKARQAVVVAIVLLLSRSIDRRKPAREHPSTA